MKFLNGYYHALSDFRVFISSQSNNGNLTQKIFQKVILVTQLNNLNLKEKNLADQH